MESPRVACATRRVTAMLLCCAALSACSKDSLSSGGNGGGTADARRLRDSIVVSGPLTPGYSIVRPAVMRPRPSAMRVAADSTGNQVAYVSLPPGSFDGGDSVRIIASGYPVTVPMINGGFDPVAAYAGVSDSVSVEVFRGSEQIGPVFASVPLSHAPTVVRTAPPRGARDIPINQEIVIVFSQPIDSATVTSTSVKILLNGAPIAATRSVLAIQPWVVRLTPSALLTPSATYTIAIDGTVKDANGLPLAAPVSADFVTGTSADSVASVAVYALGGGWGRLPSPVAVAAPGGTVQYTAYEVSLAGDTLTPASSAPITWSSSDPTVATVDGAGLVTAVASGGANVNACTGTVCGQGQIIVDTIPIGLKPIQLGDLGTGYSNVQDMAGGFATGFVKMTVAGATTNRAFLWSKTKGMEDLGTLPGARYCEAYMVNSKGVVIGDCGDYSSSSDFIWSRSTGMQPLAYPDSRSGGWYPVAINSNGEIAWASGAEDAVAFWSPTTGMHINPAPAESTSVSGMNDLGQLLVSSLTPRNVFWIVAGSTGQVLTTVSSAGTLETAGINNSGVVSGQMNWDVDPTPFRWSAALGFSYLPPLGPGGTSGPLRINSAGDVTLYLVSYRHIGSDSLFEASSAIWMADGTIVALGGLGGTHTFVNGINDSHQAAGHSQVGSSAGPASEAVIWNIPSGAVGQVARATAGASNRQPALSPRVAPRVAPRVVTPSRKLRVVL